MNNYHLGNLYFHPFLLQKRTIIRDSSAEKSGWKNRFCHGAMRLTCDMLAPAHCLRLFTCLRVDRSQFDPTRWRHCAAVDQAPIDQSDAGERRVCCRRLLHSPRSVLAAVGWPAACLLRRLVDVFLPLHQLTLLVATKAAADQLLRNSTFASAYIHRRLPRRHPLFADARRSAPKAGFARYF